MSSSPGSLRELYAPPLSAWSFESVGDQAPAGSASAPLPSAAYMRASRPAPNSLLDLSPSLADPGVPNASLLVKAIVASALMQYTTAAIAMPFEVGKTLLQVQWVPRDADELPPADEEVTVVEEVSDMDLNEEDDSYFADPSSSRTAKYPKPRPADERGYVTRRSMQDAGTRPEYIIPVGSAAGVWAMVKSLGRFRGEGWLSLWKGLLTSCIHDFLSSSLQPIVHSSLRALVIPHLISYSHSSSIIVPLVSHIVTGIIVSPLDLVRTRLIVQSSMTRHTSYSGPLNGLSRIIKEEGGISGLYFHPHLLIPTILDRGAAALAVLALPRFLAVTLGPAHIAPDTHPLSWALAELVASCAGLLVTVPLETVRRRLQVQVRGHAEPIRGCVETRPAAYNGVVDALWHIITEERSDLPLKPRRSQAKSAEAQDTQDNVQDIEGSDSWRKNTGIGQLYRGLSLRVGASLVVFFVGLLGGGEEPELGWTEL